MTERSKDLLLAAVCLLLASVIVFFITRGMVPVAAAICVAPFLGYAVAKAFDDRVLSLSFLLVVSFVIPVAAHYLYSVPTGLFMDALVVFNLTVMLCSAMNGKRSRNHLTPDLIIAISVWVLYCFLEVFNPNARIGVWFNSMRGVALYFILVVIIVQLAIEDFDQLMKVLGLWSVLIMVAFLKMMYQRFVGWTPGDSYFLNVMDGKRTHIIYYGTRFFSIYSDAANCGGGMGVAAAVYAVLGLHDDRIMHRIWWFIVAACALVGMFLSGTRSALPVPVAAILVYLVLNKNVRLMVPVGLALALAVGILAFTDIGQSNTFIRRARTIFEKNEDPSYLLRKQNQAELRKILKTMPFGNSLGMSAGRAQKHGDYGPVTYYPTDSWLVFIWVETGIVGLICYLLVMAYILMKGCWIIFFQLKDKKLVGVMAGLMGGVFGLLVMSTNNEVLQIPNNIFLFLSLAVIFTSPQLEARMQAKQKGNGKESIVHNGGL